MQAYFENKVAVVTGGASGIGLALGEELLALGAKAVVLILTEDDMRGARYGFLLEYSGTRDTYFVNVAQQRRNGNLKAI